MVDNIIDGFDLDIDSTNLVDMLKELMSANKYLDLLRSNAEKLNKVLMMRPSSRMKEHANSPTQRIQLPNLMSEQVLKISWDELIATPFSDWYSSGGAAKMNTISEQMGTDIGNAMSNAIMGSFGFLSPDKIDEGSVFLTAGTSAGSAFFTSFLAEIDSEAIAKKLTVSGNVNTNDAGSTETKTGAKTVSAFAATAATLGLTVLGAKKAGGAKALWNKGKKLFGKTGKPANLDPNTTKTTPIVPATPDSSTWVPRKNRVPVPETPYSSELGPRRRSFLSRIKHSKIAKLGKKLSTPLTIATELIDIATSDNKLKAVATSVGGLGGMWGGMAAGAATGAAIGTVVPVAGNIIGGALGLVGGAVGYWLGKKSSGALYENVVKKSKPKSPSVANSDIPSFYEIIGNNTLLPVGPKLEVRNYEDMLSLPLSLSPVNNEKVDTFENSLSPQTYQPQTDMTINVPTSVSLSFANGEIDYATLALKVGENIADHIRTSIENAQ